MLSHKMHKVYKVKAIHGYLIYPPKPKYSARLTETSRGLRSPPLPRIDYQLIAMLKHPLVMTRQQQREQRTT